MFNKAKNKTQAAAQTDDVRLDDAAAAESYRQELAQLIEENAARQAWLKRELERQQGLIAAAAGMEKSVKDRLKAEQNELNRLDEESRAAILALAKAKQKSDELNRAYNKELERVKKLHTQVDIQSDELLAQQQQAKKLVGELQQQSYYGSRQEHAMQALQSGTTTDLPPITGLVPPQEEATPEDNGAKNHANADFWVKNKHTALKLKNTGANTPAPKAADTEAAAQPAEDISPKSRLKVAFSYALCIMLAVAAALAIRTWVLMPTEVSGSSMSPTLNSDDKLLTSPLPYLWGEPDRGDIIVFQAPNEPEGIYYVKRVIGLPGDTVLIEDGAVYVNGTLLNEPYLNGVPTEGYINTQVPADTVFVLGDNRTVSHDSRADDVACVDQDKIYGKAVWRIAPFSDFGSVY